MLYFQETMLRFLHSAIIYSELHYLNGEHCVACRVSGGIRGPKDGYKSLGRCGEIPVVVLQERLSFFSTREIRKFR